MDYKSFPEETEEDTVKVELQRTTKGRYFIELPDDLLRVKGWKEGDVVVVLSGAVAQARKEDLILRKGD